MLNRFYESHVDLELAVQTGFDWPSCCNNCSNTSISGCGTTDNLFQQFIVL